MVSGVPAILGKCFCATRKTAGFNRIFLDNFEVQVYTGSAFCVNKESIKTQENCTVAQIYNQMHAFGIGRIGWFCVNKK